MDVETYLEVNNYSSVDEWAADSDYCLTDNGWVDEYGNVVDIHAQLLAAIESYV